MYDNIFDMHEREPGGVPAPGCATLVLFEPDTELYLLDADGTVLAKTGPTPLAAGLRASRSARCASRSSRDRTRRS